MISEDQLLAEVVKAERPDLEELKVTRYLIKVVIDCKKNRNFAT